MQNQFFLKIVKYVSLDTIPDVEVIQIGEKTPLTNCNTENSAIILKDITVQVKKVSLNDFFTS